MQTTKEESMLSPNPPLPGGIAGASVELHPLCTGEIQLRVLGARQPRRGPLKLLRTFAASTFNEPTWCPVPAFLVVHPSAGPLLVDVGYDPSVARDPAQTMGNLFGKVLMRHRLAEGTLREQVVAAGIDPKDVRTVVMTHLHIDHASGAREWPGTTFVVDRTERRAAGSPREGGYFRPNLATVNDWLEVDYRGPHAEPFSGFSRTLDLFGDGAVRLISSPGHSRGHQSVLLRGHEGDVLICGDSVMSTVQLESEELLVDGLLSDQPAYLDSLAEARAFARTQPSPFTIPSHDGELWRNRVSDGGRSEATPDRKRSTGQRVSAAASSSREAMSSLR